MLTAAYCFYVNKKKIFNRDVLHKLKLLWQTNLQQKARYKTGRIIENKINYKVNPTKMVNAWLFHFSLLSMSFTFDKPSSYLAPRFIKGIWNHTPPNILRSEVLKRLLFAFKLSTVCLSNPLNCGPSCSLTCLLSPTFIFSN